MSDEVAARLAKPTNSGATRKDGAVVTITSLVKDPSPFTEGATRVKAVGVDAEGNDFSEYVTPNQAKALLSVEDLLPVELKVTTFPGQFNKTGYGFEAPSA